MKDKSRPARSAWLLNVSKWGNYLGYEEMRRLHALISHALEWGFAQTQIISLFSRTPTGVNVIQSVCLWKGSRDKRHVRHWVNDWNFCPGWTGETVHLYPYVTPYERVWLWVLTVEVQVIRTRYRTEESGLDCGSESYPYTIPYVRKRLWRWK